jgi:nanoRNase/pAp phosphatase (c-di-AMP/oligoRNAs hydrolase)
VFKSRTSSFSAKGIRIVDQTKFRLVTRSDFDGLVCAILLNELDMIDRDITTNLPYVAAAHMVFDHHDSETIRNTGERANHIISGSAPSAARVVYEHYGGAQRFPNISLEMMAAVDKADSAQFTRDDVLSPQGWELLSFLMDSRTGLGRFRDFRISNYQLMMDLIKYCRDHSIAQILQLPDVLERVELYKEHEIKALEQIMRCSKIHKKLVVLDLREEKVIYAANRFMIYALYPQCNISIHVMWGVQKQNTVFATGKSIFDRSNPINVGELMLTYGGGGHQAAGTCQVDNDAANATLQELIAHIHAAV